MANAPPPDAFQLMLRYCWWRCQCSITGIESETYGRRCDVVCVPCAVCDFQILDAVLFLAWLAKDVTSRVSITDASVIMNGLTGIWRL